MPKNIYLMNNPGAILRRMFPKQLNTQGLIILWTIVFILNIAAAFCVHYYILYPISDFSREALQENDYFDGAEIVSVEELKNYYVTYVNEDGEKRVARLEMFPGRVFKRARIDKDYDCVANANGTIVFPDDTLSNILWTGNVLKKLAGIYLGIGVALLLFEFFIYGALQKRFQE